MAKPIHTKPRFVIRQKNGKTIPAVEYLRNSPLKDEILGKVVYEIELPIIFATQFNVNELSGFYKDGTLAKKIEQSKRPVNSKTAERLRRLQDVIRTSDFEGERNAAKALYDKLIGE